MSPETAHNKTAVIIEDDPDVRHVLVGVLESAGFSTVSVGNGIDGVQAVLTYRPALTTLDLNIPGIDGFETARRIRAQSDTFIIVVSALDDEADVVLSLGAGADEYITKPFRAREFRARIDAVMRRQQPVPAPPQQRPESVGPSFPGGRQHLQAYAGHAYAQPPVSAADRIAPAPPVYAMPSGAPSAPADAWVAPSPAGATAPGTELELADGGDGAGERWLRHRDLRLNPETRVVIAGDRVLELTRTEFDLLATLLESKRRVRSKADLTLVLRGESYVTSYFVGEADKRAVEAHMTNLRRKLGDSAASPRYIETVRGVGYRLTAEVLTGP
ncbi:response regulator transcription factor [Microbacterium album]|uniref:Two-component system response regulator n=1 Tax=Microbacterium album TaxID=2053191 RepID=A0A917IFA6_9MICO|nr:response regulator transcription factor [Microbacterium album]GGH39781.1 hypothetical protein GCM10010921_11270 [Microbacterium album]